MSLQNGEVKGNQQMGMLLSVQNLTYAPAIDGSLINNRQYKELNFSPLQYTGLAGAPQLVINSGGDYIFGPTSYIKFNIKSADANSSLASTAYDIFKEFEINHRTGDLIDRVNNVNGLIHELLKYQEGPNYSNGLLAGGVGNGYAGVMGRGSGALNADAGVDVVLPLSWFSGFFAQKALIPAPLIAGATMKLQFENINRAIKQASGVANITISSMTLVLDSYELMDSAVKALTAQMANVKTSGLQYSFSSWQNTNKTFDGTSFDLDINLSAAKTMLVLAKTRETDEFKAAQDSMTAEAYPYSRWRLRLGSETQPQHEVKTSAEAYVITQSAFGQKHVDDVSTRNGGYTNISVDFASYKTSSIICVDMEKSNILAHSGRATNNARLINLNGEFTGAASRQMDVWVQILKVANVMKDNVVVDK